MKRNRTSNQTAWKNILYCSMNTPVRFPGSSKIYSRLCLSSYDIDFSRFFSISGSSLWKIFPSRTSIVFLRFDSIIIIIPHIVQRPLSRKNVPLSCSGSSQFPEQVFSHELLSRDPSSKPNSSMNRIPIFRHSQN